MVSVLCVCLKSVFLFFSLFSDVKGHVRVGWGIYLLKYQWIGRISSEKRTVCWKCNYAVLLVLSSYFCYMCVQGHRNPQDSETDNLFMI